MILYTAKSIRGEIEIPGDKSISHRSVMFGAIAQGLTEVTHFLDGADCNSTIACFRALGVEIEKNANRVLIHGKGLHGLQESASLLDVGNSGTTTRLLAGILAGQSFTTRLNGDASIQKRPMKRIMTPLQQMGAQVISLNNNDCAPLEISGGHLKGITYQSPVASAQVKSCVLLAGLYADGKTTVVEPAISRNHTEIMLSGFGAEITCSGNAATVAPEPTLVGQQIHVPGDISSAAYFIAAALLCPNAELLIKNVGINPTRDGFLRVAKAMGGNITLLNERTVSGEKVADLLVKSSSLKGTVVSGEIIPTLIDEIPMIAVMAAFADGETVISDAAELKAKESNRIDTVVEGLRNLSVEVTPKEDGMIIQGGKVSGGKVNSYLDHRIAMSFAIASLASDGPIEIQDADCVNISYPHFYEDLNRLKL